MTDGTEIEGKTELLELLGDEGVPLFPDGFARTKLFAASPSVKAKKFGADPEGVNDSGPAITEAIADLPADGGDVYIGAGHFKIATTILAGDGPGNATPSTRHGIQLIGANAPQGSSYFMQNTPVPGTCRLFTPSAIDLLHVLGPMQGFGMHNIHFDGQGVGLVGVTEQALQWSLSRGCRIGGFAQIGQLCKPVVGNPALPPNHMHNRYEMWVIEVPNVAGAHGLWLKGNGSNTSTNCCFDMWEDLTTVYAAGSNTVTGVRIGWCDTNFFSKVHMIPLGSSYNHIAFDYTGEGAQLPGSNFFEHITFNGHVINIGTPSGSPGPNNIAQIASANGVPSNPGLANLAWGITAANP
jgi:hypothetical protein